MPEQYFYFLFGVDCLIGFAMKLFVKCCKMLLYKLFDLFYSLSANISGFSEVYEVEHLLLYKWTAQCCLIRIGVDTCNCRCY